MGDNIRVRVVEPQPWVDRTRPAPPGKVVDEFQLPRSRADLLRRRRRVFAEVTDQVGRDAVRSVSVAVEGQECDVVVYLRPVPPGGAPRRRPVVRGGPHGGPLGRTMRALKRQTRR